MRRRATNSRRRRKLGELGGAIALRAHLLFCARKDPIPQRILPTQDQMRRVREGGREEEEEEEEDEEEEGGGREKARERERKRESDATSFRSIAK